MRLPCPRPRNIVNSCYLSSTCTGEHYTPSPQPAARSFVTNNCAATSRADAANSCVADNCAAVSCPTNHCAANGCAANGCATVPCAAYSYAASNDDGRSSADPV